DLGDQRYLLSPQDLAAFELIPALIEAGVSCFKIEGRLKTPEYVANITLRYREAIDMALAKQPVEFSQQTMDEMELSFSRGFSPGWLQGCDHKMLVPADSSSKRGVLLGEIESVNRDWVTIRIVRDREIRNGDGVVFEGDREHDLEQGGRVYETRKVRSAEGVTDNLVEIAFGRDSINFRDLYPGQKIWKTDDPALTKRLRKTFRSKRANRRIAIDFHVFAAVGQVLRISAALPNGQTVSVQSDSPLELARKHAATETTIREQLDRLGNTPYEIGALRSEITDGPMIPLSLSGSLRKSLIGAIDSKLITVPVRTLAVAGVARKLRDENVSKIESNETNDKAEPRLHVLCRTMDQLRIVIDAGITSAMADFQDIVEYRDAVAFARERSVPLYIATPRIQKPGEAGLFRKMAGYSPDGILVRNLSGIDFCRDADIPMVADFSLNVANELTAAMLLESKVQRVTASYDLNREQLIDLVHAAPARWFEVVVHQHMPMFHMEHCVFCAVLSPGTNKNNCGRPCDVHSVKLRDRVGAEHTLLADVGCRNTLFNQKPQSAAEIVPDLLNSGIRDFRIELLDHSDTVEITKVICLYRELLAGRKTGREVWTSLQAANRVGVTRGTLEEKRDPLAIL
ncbi:DUF3656 domain-containing protein, partial [Planctomycetota bacterium]